MEKYGTCNACPESSPEPGGVSYQVSSFFINQVISAVVNALQVLKECHGGIEQAVDNTCLR